MNPEFKKHLDEIRDYVEGVSAEARSPLMQALLQRLLEEFRPGHLPHHRDVFTQRTQSAPKAAEPESVSA